MTHKDLKWWIDVGEEQSEMQRLLSDILVAKKAAIALPSDSTNKSYLDAFKRYTNFVTFITPDYSTPDHPRMKPIDLNLCWSKDPHNVLAHLHD